MADPAADPAERPTAEIRQGHRRHRAIVWTLVVLASFLLIFSITANWVQQSLLDTNQVAHNTDAILADQDVQDQLSVFAVDQLYANVDVQAEIQKQLPPPAQPFAGVVAAAARNLAVTVAEKALASPQVQGLVSTAVTTAHQQLISLIENKDQFVSTTGGQVTFQYGAVIADLAARLGIDPTTITDIQSAVQSFTGELRTKLETAQTDIESARANIAQAQSGTLSSETQANLTQLNTLAGQLSSDVKGIQKKLAGVQSQVPSQLKSKFKDLEGVLADLQSKLTLIEKRTAAALKDPSTANLDALDASLATLQSRVTTLLNSQAVQNPGQLVLLESSQLSGIQTAVAALRNLGIVLPLLVFFLFLAALWFAGGWRREALIAIGGGIVVATLIVLTAKRMVGNEIGSLASTETAKPAVESVWDILSQSLRDRGRFILVIGLGFLAAGAVAGPTGWAVSTRRFIAPFLRDHPVATYAIVGVLYLLFLSFMPGVASIGQVLVVIFLAFLTAFGVEMLRRQTAREFPGAGTRTVAHS